VLQPLGQVCVGEGDFEQAVRYSEESITVARAVGNPRQLATALNGYAQLLRLQRDLIRAEAMYEEVVQILAGLGDRESVAIAQLNLAVVAMERGRFDAARALLGQALQAATSLGSQMVGQATLDMVAGLNAEAGQHSLAVQFFGAAEAQAERSGLRRDSADAAFLLPLIERARRAVGEAAAALQAEGAGWGYEDAIRRAAELLARPVSASDGSITPD
jgi:tetratricopeptide (TPR) repeat protein